MSSSQLVPCRPPPPRPRAGRDGTGSLGSSGIPSGTPQPILRAQGGALSTRLLLSVPGPEPGSRLALAPLDPLEPALRSPPRGFPGPQSPRSASREPRALQGSPGPRRPGAPRGAPCATNPAPKLANLAPGGARGVCPSRAGRRLGRGRRGVRGGAEPGRLGSRGVGAGPHLPGGSAAAVSPASAGRGGSRSGGSSSSSAGQSRQRAAPAGGSMAAGPQPGPRTRSRRESSPRAAQPTSGGSWSRPQLQHRRARGGGGEARRKGRGSAEGRRGEGRSERAREAGGREKASEGEGGDGGRLSLR